MERQLVRIQEEDESCFHPHLLYCCESKITLFTCGEGVVDVGNTIHSIAPGDVFYIPGYQFHTFRFAFESQLTGLSIYFNNSRSPSAMFSVPELRKIGDLLSQYSNGFKITGAGNSDMAKKLLAAKEEHGLQLLIRFLELLAEVYRCNDIVSLVSEKNSNDRFEEERLKKVISHIYQHFNTAICLNEMAEMAHLTKESFCRYFKRHTGHSLAHFVNEVRIGEVCRRLCTQQATAVISTVAYECGFRNMSHFNKIFKGVMGVNPNQYMRNKQAEANLNDPEKSSQCKPVSS